MSDISNIPYMGRADETNLKSRLVASMTEGSRLSRLGGPWAERKSNSSASPSLESWYESSSGRFSKVFWSQVKSEKVLLVKSQELRILLGSTPGALSALPQSIRRYRREGEECRDKQAPRLIGRRVFVVDVVCFSIVGLWFAVTKMVVREKSASVSESETIHCRHQAGFSRFFQGCFFFLFAATLRPRKACWGVAPPMRLC